MPARESKFKGGLEGAKEFGESTHAHFTHSRHLQLSMAVAVGVSFSLLRAACTVGRKHTLGYPQWPTLLFAVLVVQHAKTGVNVAAMRTAGRRPPPGRGCSFCSSKRSPTPTWRCARGPPHACSQPSAAPWAACLHPHSC